MPVETAADRLIFVNPDEHGVTALITPSGQPQAPIDGVFEDPHEEADVGLELPVSSTLPSLRCPDETIVGVQRGDPVIVNGTTYEVADRQPDGTGFTRLMLHQV